MTSTPFDDGIDIDELDGFTAELCGATATVKDEPMEDSEGAIAQLKAQEQEVTPRKAKKARTEGSPVVKSEFGDDPKADCVCMGCDRPKHGGVSLTDPEAVLPWAFPDGRGRLCLVCHNTYRTCLQSTQSPSFFGTWLKTPANKQQFQLYVIANCVLSHQGQTKKTSSMIHDMSNTIKVVAAMLGKPLGAHKVVPLADYVACGEGVSPPPIDAKLLVNMADKNGGTSLGVLCPCSDETQVVPGLANHGRFSAISPLITIGQTELALLAEHVSGVTVSDKPMDMCASHSKDTAKTKNENRFNAAVKESRDALGVFGGDLWVRAKVAQLTKCITSMSTISGAAGVDGNAEIHASSQAWIFGLSSAKKVLKLHHDLEKSSKGANMAAKLGESASASRELAAFLRKEGLLVSSSFAWFELRAAFQQAINDNNSVADAFEAMKDLGLSETICSDTDDNRPLLVMRTQIVDALKNQILAKSDSEVSARAEEFHASVVKLLANVRGALDTVALTKVQPLVCDLDALRAFVAGAAGRPEGVNALKDASHRVTECLPLKQFDTDVGKTDLWRYVTANVAASMKLSSKDKIADGKLDRARSMLCEIAPSEKDADPSVGDPPDVDKTFRDVDNVLDWTIVESLDESVRLVVEATDMWSELRAGEKAKAVMQWFTELSDLMIVIDRVVTLHMMTMISKHICALSAEDLPSEQDLQCLDRTIREHFTDSNCWDSFISRLRGVVEGLPKHVMASKDCVGIVEKLEAIEESLVASSHLRQETISLLATIASLGRTPASIKDAIQDWQSNAKKGQSDTTCSDGAAFAGARNSPWIRAEGRHRPSGGDGSGEIRFAN